MPICNKPPLAMGDKSIAAEIDDHASEAAKVKRTREQAYFNSYDFDAIEVLPSDDDDITLKNASEAPTLRNISGKATQKYARTLKQSTTLSPNSRSLQHHLPNASSSLSSKSDTSAPSSSSSRSSGSYSHHHHHRRQQSEAMKSAYMQRLGAFFVSTHDIAQRSALELASTHSSVSSDEPMPKREVILAVRSDSEAEVIGDGTNFLLPRAMLKYQSVASSNSMPLSVISVSHAGTGGELLQNGNSNLNNNSHNNNKIKTTMMTTSSNSAAKILRTPPALAAAAAASIASIKTSQSTNGHDAATGFQMTTPGKAVVITARNKKQSTSSTTTTATATSGTDSVVSLNHATPNVDATNRNTNLAKFKASAVNTVAANEPTQRARASSHQSHYSTDKSGSSGYYSSNVCSTYSLEDHIYCEPVIDILDLNSQSKSVIAGKVTNHITNNRLQQQLPAVAAAAAAAKTTTSELQSSSRTKEMNGVGQSQRYAVDCEEDEDEPDGGEKAARVKVNSNHSNRQLTPTTTTTTVMTTYQSPHFNENLRILETSIENLDRHLKNFPSLSSQERIASFVQAAHHHTPLYLDHVVADKLRPYNHLPTIMEGYDPVNQQSRTWQDDIVDDSLLDIDLDSFLLVNERKGSKRIKSVDKPTPPAVGIDNPSFLTDEQEENNYKCAKYINSCPEDAYRVESDIVAGTTTGTVSSEKSATVEIYPKRYEDQLHFQSTRELLEDVRDKIRLLSKSANTDQSLKPLTNQDDIEMPQELDGMIKTLKRELEIYLSRMNQHSELEIRQLCSGLVKNQNIVRMKKAFERRRSAGSLGVLDSEYDFSAYEAIRESGTTLVPFSIRQKITSIRCASDPNFKMKRKSLTEVFPATDCYIATVNENLWSQRANVTPAPTTQLQRNLSFHKPILNQLNANAGPNRDIAPGGLNGGAESGDSGGDKDSILEWHRQKPSSWEMYYGTNRMSQSLLGKRNGGVVVDSSQASMSYPSSRPESDFTLDLPRAEQLRIKMDKEKKFRQRCRYITTFLSLVFFLLTVMVVSLVLTRGKRMFGSMI